VRPVTALLFNSTGTCTRFFVSSLIRQSKKQAGEIDLSVPVTLLAEQAMESARSGRTEEAEQLWREILGAEPRHTQALRNLGTQALQQGDADEALKLLEAARLTAPTDLFVLLALADARGSAGNADGEIEAIQWALAVDPLYVPALLKKGGCYERRNIGIRASAAYADALRNAGPEAQWPTQLRVDLSKARVYIERHSRVLHAHLLSELDGDLGELDVANSERWCEAASIHAGKSSPFVSASSQFHIPRLPAVPFIDRREFSFLAGLEAGVVDIRDELLSVLEQDEFEPYMSIRPDKPVDQWQELNHSARWSAFHLWKDGSPVEKNLDRCPMTAQLLQQVELCSLSGLCPSVFFSALAPKTRIPPHHGETNARVTGHLPLIVPDDCCLRVGFEQRQWQEGECLVFDDTIEHQSINDSTEQRVVMVFDLWNPLLSDSDRRMAGALVNAVRDFGS